MKRKFNTKDGVLMLFGVAVLAALFVYTLLYTNHDSASFEQGGPRYAPSGMLAPGFPTELVLDQAAIINQSYSVHYPPNTDQYTAVYHSTVSPQDLFGLYQNYFNDNGWQIAKRTVTSFLDALYATKGSAVTNLVITASSTSTQVIVGYLVQ